MGRCVFIRMNPERLVGMKTNKGHCDKNRGAPCSLSSSDLFSKRWFFIQSPGRIPASSDPLLEQCRNLLVGANRCDGVVCGSMQLDKVRSCFDRLNIQFRNGYLCNTCFATRLATSLARLAILRRCGASQRLAHQCRIGLVALSNQILSDLCRPESRILLRILADNLGHVTVFLCTFFQRCTLLKCYERAIRSIDRLFKSDKRKRSFLL